MPQFVRSAVLTNYAEIARSVGLDPFDMLQSVGLRPACLAEKDVRIPVDAVRRLLKDSAAVSGAENFGLRMAQTRRLSILGNLGMAARDAPNLRALLEIVFGHMRLHNESLMLHIEDVGGMATIRQDLVVPERGGMRQSVELSLGALLRILRIYLGEDWTPQHVWFIHQAPVDQSLHRRFFGHTLEFGCEMDAIVCRSKELDTPIASSDPVMADYARRQFSPELMAQDDPIVRDVRGLILILLPAGRCGIEQVARHLSRDPRTVQRQLAAHGHSFSELVARTREALSDRYLENPARQLSDIALMLGFAGASAYARWHQQRLGMTAGQRRKWLRSQGETGTARS